MEDYTELYWLESDDTGAYYNYIMEDDSIEQQDHKRNN